MRHGVGRNIKGKVGMVWGYDTNHGDTRIPRKQTHRLIPIHNYGRFIGFNCPVCRKCYPRK